jgi:hypothetical protein
MSGQVWHTNSEGGYMWSPNLSKYLRTAMQPMSRFRQMCDIEPAVGKHAGSKFYWNVYGDVESQGGVLNEQVAMPETKFSIDQSYVELEERGNSVPYTGKLDDLSEHPVKTVIEKALKNDANKAMEIAAHAEFDDTLLIVTPYNGSSATAITVEVDGTPAATNSVALGNAHVKLILDEMKERNIPVRDGSNYFAIGRPATFRDFKDDLEAIGMYTERGFGLILNSEIGRHYDGCRFFEQTVIASEGWTNAVSDAAYFFGDDAVVEGIAVPEEVRGKIPTDYGRSKGVAWYAINGFAIVHNVTGAAQNRIVKWASAA